MLICDMMLRAIYPCYYLPLSHLKGDVMTSLNVSIKSKAYKALSVFQNCYKATTKHSLFDNESECKYIYDCCSNPKLLNYLFFWLAIKFLSTMKRTVVTTVMQNDGNIVGISIGLVSGLWSTYYCLRVSSTLPTDFRIYNYITTIRYCLDNNLKCLHLGIGVDLIKSGLGAVRLPPRSE